ncbi:glutathione binding-like protein [Qipengyuania sp. MTN3-11]|uniref:glutathione binding-like protein n=1 Tax=Qipengyuania sp. MTN3-11 TaxID=3056557 RepID=UPI0036F3B80A
MKLYYSPGACSLASHIALIEGGIEHETVKVDLKKHETENGEDFYKISPRGYVPAIETEDMGLLTENPAVLAYVADRMGAPPQGTDRYRMLEWIGFTGTEIHGGYHPLFGGDSDERQAKAKDGLAKKYRLAADLMEGHDWLVGNGPTVADNYLFVTLLWADKFGIELPQEMKDFRERNMQREAVKQAMADEGLS